MLYLSNLLTLHLELYPIPIAGDTEKLLQRPVFCALHLLNVKCETLDLLDAFFKTLSIAPKILSFSIANVMDCARALLVSISRVSNAYASGVLNHLQIEVNVLYLDAVNTSIDAETFQYICTFYNLRKLDFQSERDVQLDDTTLLQMAKAWLLLEELVIYGPLEVLGVTSLTISLQMPSSHCCNIVHI